MPNTNNKPSLFIFATTEATDDGEHVTCDMTIDLAMVALVAKRPVGGGYWLNLGGQSIPMPEAAGVALREALIAYKGKFNPQTDR